MALKKKKGLKIKRKRTVKGVDTQYLRRKYGEGVELQVYDLAKQGMSDTAISDALNIPKSLFDRWEERDDIIGISMRAGRKYHADDKNRGTFQEYVYDQLPVYLKDVWERLNECEDAPCSITRIEALLEHHGRTARQHLFLYALVAFNFSVNKALCYLGISSRVFYNWKNTDDEFAEIMDLLHFHKKNFFEDALMKLVQAGHPHAIIHCNKTVNQDRGYGSESKVNVSIQGEIRHSVDMVNIEELDLDLDMRKALLVKIREAKNANELETIEVKAISSVLSEED